MSWDCRSGKRAISSQVPHCRPLSKPTLPRPKKAGDQPKRNRVEKDAQCKAAERCPERVKQWRRVPSFHDIGLIGVGWHRVDRIDGCWWAAIAEVSELVEYRLTCCEGVIQRTNLTTPRIVVVTVCMINNKTICLNDLKHHVCICVYYIYDMFKRLGP